MKLRDSALFLEPRHVPANHPAPSPDHDPHLSYPSVRPWTGGGADDSTPVEIDLTTDPEAMPDGSFDPTLWIGAGKEWSDDLPACVKAERDAARAIPPTISNVVVPPGDTTPVSRLIDPDPEYQPSDTQTCQLGAPAYCPEPPTFIPDGSNIFNVSQLRQLLSHSLPHQPVLQAGFNSAWLAGSTSIMFDATFRVPLWTEHLLTDFRVFEEKLRKWNASQCWLERFSNTCTLLEEASVIAECRSALEYVPYSRPVPGFSPAVILNTTDLTVLLSDEWLNDELMNGGSEYILRKSGARNRRRIINCLFVRALSNIRERSSVYSPRRYSALETSIVNGDVDRLYIPLHVYGNHWTLLEMNLVSRTFSYADSLNDNTAPPPRTMKLLQWWITGLQPHANAPNACFEVSPPSFIMPRQWDTFSCGVVVLSTLAHIILNYPPWSPDTYQLERMRWFLRMSDYLVEVCCLCDNSVPQSNAKYSESNNPAL